MECGEKRVIINNVLETQHPGKPYSEYHAHVLDHGDATHQKCHHLNLWTCGRVKAIECFAENMSICKSCFEENKRRKQALVIEEDHTPSLQRKLDALKKYARERDFSWNLRDSVALQMFQQDCFYCGGSPNPFNGIDRQNNDIRSYDNDNIVAACAKCNFTKLDHSANVFINICKTIATHRGLGDFGTFPSAFRDSGSKKSFRQYAHAGNRTMEMSKAVFDALLVQDCFFCGKANAPPTHYNGVDRLDSNDRSYSVKNCVACCKTCNTLKWCMHVKDFLNHCLAVARFNTLLNSLPP